MSRVWMSRVTHLNESCHAYACITSHVWMSHVTHMNESCYTHESCHTCEMTHSYVWHDSFIHVHDSFICAIWQVTRASPPHTPYVTWLIHNSFTRVTWPMSDPWLGGITAPYKCVMSHIHVWMHYVTRMNESCHIYEWVMSHIWTHLGLWLWTDSSFVCHVPANQGGVRGLGESEERVMWICMAIATLTTCAYTETMERLVTPENYKWNRDPIKRNLTKNNALVHLCRQIFWTQPRGIMCTTEFWDFSTPASSKIVSIDFSKST